MVDTNALMIGSSRISSISKSSKTKKLGVLYELYCSTNQVFLFSRAQATIYGMSVSEHGWQWMVCEGFQFILKHQAEALLDLGVCSYFKVCTRLSGLGQPANFNSHSIFQYEPTI